MESALQDFLGYLKVEKNYSEHTVRNYRSDLIQFIRFLGERSTNAEAGESKVLRPEQVHYLDIRAYLASLYRRNAKSSVARKLSAIRSFFA